jgi:hypothetical protein
VLLASLPVSVASVVLTVGTGGLCRAGTYPNLQAPMLAKVLKNTAKVPNITRSDAGECTQNTAKLPKITYSMGMIRLSLACGEVLGPYGSGRRAGCAGRRAAVAHDARVVHSPGRVNHHLRTSGE